MAHPIMEQSSVVAVTSLRERMRITPRITDQQRRLFPISDSSFLVTDDLEEVEHLNIRKDERRGEKREVFAPTKTKHSSVKGSCE